MFSSKLLKLVFFIVLSIALNTNSFSDDHNMPQLEKFNAIQNVINKTAETQGLKKVSIEWHEINSDKYIATIKSDNKKSDISFSEQEITAAHSEIFQPETIEKIKNTIQLLKDTGNKGPE